MENPALGKTGTFLFDPATAVFPLSLRVGIRIGEIIARKPFQSHLLSSFFNCCYEKIQDCRDWNVPAGTGGNE
jgi:hypothetical protein